MCTIIAHNKANPHSQLRYIETGSEKYNNRKARDQTVIAISARFYNIRLLFREQLKRI